MESIAYYVGYYSFFIVTIIAIICALVGGNITKNKGRGKNVGQTLGFFLGPLGLLIVAIISKNPEKIQEMKYESGEMKKCPFCAELIKSEAKVCRYCGKELPSIS